MFVQTFYFPDIVEESLIESYPFTQIKRAPRPVIYFSDESSIRRTNFTQTRKHSYDKSQYLPEASKGLLFPSGATLFIFCNMTDSTGLSSNEHPATTTPSTTPVLSILYACSKATRLPEDPESTA